MLYLCTIIQKNIMKKGLLFTIIIALCSVVYAEIPAGKTIYLDCSQHWCCQGSYFVYLSRDSKSHLMTPVPGQPGVYQYTTTTSTQDNLRFCCTAGVVTTDQNGQQNPHTEDVNGYSSSRPYYIIDDEQGHGHWAAQPSSTGGVTAFTDWRAEVGKTSCTEAKYNVDIIASWSGVACMIQLTGADLATPIERKSPKSPFTYRISDLTDVSTGNTHIVHVKLYADAQGTNLIEEIDVDFTAPEFECVETHDLGERCLRNIIGMESSFEGMIYEWSTGDSLPEITHTLTETGDLTFTCNTYNTVLSLQNNMMVNGGFENGHNGFSSDYRSVTYTGTEYYSSNGSIKNNIIAVIGDANYFWHDYAQIQPHSGNYFALFDAGKSGYAWKTTTALNSSLVLQAGKDYIFSYWAAYPNQKPNNSPAVLQFVIEYTDQNGVRHTENLGTPYTLGNEVEMNGWYQKAYVFHCQYSSNDVLIGVYDLNTDTEGNDFCLDDVVFQEVTEENLQLAYTDIFTVKVKDCDNPNPEPECPQLRRETIYRTVCDTMLVPGSWASIWTPREGVTYTCLTPGDYHDTLRTTLSNGVICDSIIYSLVLKTIPCEREPEECVDDYVMRKWTNVLFVNNGAEGLKGDAVGYQWLRDGLAINGATEQFLYEANGIGGKIAVRIQLKDGSQITTCGHLFDEYPCSNVKNPGTRGAMVSERIYTPLPSVRIIRREYENGEVEITKTLLR